VHLAVLVPYFFAVFHKLNADWFDHEGSCGVVFHKPQLETLPFLPGSDFAARRSAHMRSCSKRRFPCSSRSGERDLSAWW